MMPILVLDKDDEEREIEFELEYQQSLTTQQRIALLEEKRKFIQQQLSRYGLDCKKICLKGGL